MKKIVLAMVICCLFGCLVGCGVMEATMAGVEMYRIHNRPDYKTTLNSDLEKACAATETALRKLDIQIQDRQKDKNEVTITGATSNSKQKIQVVLKELTNKATTIEIKTGKDPQFALLIADEIKKN